MNSPTIVPQSAELGMLRSLAREAVAQACVTGEADCRFHRWQIHAWTWSIEIGQLAHLEVRYKHELQEQQTWLICHGRMHQH